VWLRVAPYERFVYIFTGRDTDVKSLCFFLTPAEYDAAIDSFQSGTYAFEISEDTFDPVKYAAFLREIEPEVAEFRARQEVALEKEKELEATLFAEWEAETKASAERDGAPRLSLDGARRRLALSLSSYFRRTYFFFYS
jgi:hypothetical protein